MWAGNKCPGLEEYHTFDSKYCIEQCDHQCVPASVLVHIANKAFVDKHIGEYVSVTALLNCLREIYLERTQPWYQEPPDSWYHVRGTLLHSILQNPDFKGLVDELGRYVIRVVEKGMTDKAITDLWMSAEADLLALADLLPKPYQTPDWQSEIEFELPLGIINGKPRFLRGTIDVLRTVLQEILDYKTIGDKGLPYIGRYGAKAEHEMQLNIYRLMVERGYPVGQKDTYKPIIIKRMRIFYLTMMELVGTGSNMVETTPFMANDPKAYGTETNRVIINERDDIVLKAGKRKDSANPDDYRLSHKKKYHIIYSIPDVRLLDLNKVMAFVLEKATVLFKAFDEGIIPPLPSIEMQVWKCDRYCPVKKFCDEICKVRGEVRAKREEENTVIPVEKI
jgi:hypothetical protein